ncbi:metallophosphoesterase [Nocardia wallacei]|uniref:P-loop NTPase n=1 Tax=Nocardia wallacei TaxID=480035 RepID=UPI00245606F0|nr:metallophosphoesterase [Nocardia wallacei]
MANAARINILHLTDIHFGQSQMPGHWPTVESLLIRDLIEYVIPAAGPIDVIAFTGDLANTAAPAEYEAANEFLSELVLSLDEASGVFASMVCVPGNHDVRRPAKRNTLPQLFLEGMWNDNMAKDLLAEGAEVRQFIEEVFEEYISWARRTPVTMLPRDTTGSLPGDFASTYEKDGLRIGFVGVNTAFRHISDWAQEGVLSVPPALVQSACGGNLPKWSQHNDVSILLTHHPLSWLSNAAEVRDVVFNGATTVRLHLCGHLHLEKYRLEGVQTEAQHFIHQGQSLFGAEWDNSNNKYSREHGYAVITIRKDISGVTARIWPRSISTTQIGTSQFDRSPTFGLKPGEISTRAHNLTIANPRSASTPHPTGRPTPLKPVKELAASDGYSREEVQKRFFETVRSGGMTAVLGDIAAIDGEGAETPFKAFRSEASSNLGLGNVDDDHASSQMLFHTLKGKDAATARALLRKHFGQPSDAMVSLTHRVLSGPWAAVLNLSPLAAVDKLRSVPGLKPLDYSVVDATTAPYRLPGVTDRFLYHMNGVVADDGTGDIRFGTEAPASEHYGAWTRFSAQLLARSTVVFLTDSIAYTDLWAYITRRSATNDRIRPAAFLVCPNLPKVYEAALSTYGVQWIRSSVAEFANSCLSTSNQKVSEGLDRISRRRSRQSAGIDLSVRAKTLHAGPGRREYLRGLEPKWGDVVDRIPAELSVLDRLEERIDKCSPGDILVVSGTAGSGRTTTLMQIALRLVAKGVAVGWVGSRSGQQISRISSIVDKVDADVYEVIIVDDADGFGDWAERLLSDLAKYRKKRRIVIAGVRSVWYNMIETVPGLKRFDDRNLTVGDAARLVAKLRDHNMVPNRRWSDRDLSDMLMKDSEGQLLVGMMQITYGLSFAKRISSECDSLVDLDLSIYGAAALATAESGVITPDIAMESADGDPNLKWEALNRLEDSGLMQSVDGGIYYAVRHRVIAEEVRKYLQKRGIFSSVLAGTLRAYAAAASDRPDNSLPERRVLIALMNHSYMIRMRLSVQDVRDIYESVEYLLDNDFHYWLQRGSYELEKGAPALALNALMTARTLEGGEDDSKVLTTFARVRLQMARKSRSLESAALAVDAVQDLFKVIAIDGVLAPHTFVILADEAVPWLVEAHIGRTELLALARKAMALLDFAKRLDESNMDVMRARRKALADLGRLINELET